MLKKPNKMNLGINKKVFFTTFAIMLLATGGIAFADELKEGLELFLKDPSYDYLGHGYDEVFLGLLEDTSSNPINTLWNDIRTTGLQFKCMERILEQNKLIYGSVGTVTAYKIALPAKAFNSIATKIARLAFKF